MKLSVLCLLIFTSMHLNGSESSGSMPLSLSFRHVANPDYANWSANDLLAKKIEDGCRGIADKDQDPAFKAAYQAKFADVPIEASAPRGDAATSAYLRQRLGRLEENLNKEQKELEREVEELRSSLEKSFNSESESTSKWVYAGKAVAIAAVVWAATEAVVAYKNISKEEWDKQKGLLSKLALVAKKTGHAMYERPKRLFS